MKYWYYISVLVLMTSCFTPEQPSDPVEPFHEVLTTDIDSAGQVYYSLKDRKVVGTSNVYQWDLGFECGTSGFNIIVNSGKGMAAYNTKITDFRIPLTSDNLLWDYDHPCGDLSMTCIGNWGDFNNNNPSSYGNVYIVNLGVDTYGRGLGYKKILIGGFIDGHYVLRFADLDGSNERLMLIPKTDGYNFTYFSFAFGGQLVDVEPPKDLWDIVFTPFIDEITDLGDYDIRLNAKLGLYHGILFNRNKRRVAVEENKDWSDITYFGSEDLDYSIYTNTIGRSFYEWLEGDKKYRVKNTLYLLKDGSENTYLIQFKAFEKEVYSARVAFQFKNL